MFWKCNAGSSMQIEALLEKDNVSLVELMEVDELLQECKAQNKRLIEFLTQPEVLEELVNLVCNEPAPDLAVHLRFKYANLAAELLTCDVQAIIEKLATSINLLMLLYQFLQNEKPLNPLLASFVSRVLCMLVQRRCEQNWYSYQFTCFQVLDFLKSKEDFVHLAVRHVGTSAIMDLLSKLACGLEDNELKQGIHQWLNDCHLIDQLVEKLTPDCDSEEHSSIDQLLCDIIGSCRDQSTNVSDSQSSHSGGSGSVLLSTLESEEIVGKLLDTLLHEDQNTSSVTHVINILITLLSGSPSSQEAGLLAGGSVASNDSIGSDSRAQVARCIAGRLADFHKLLLQPPKLESLKVAYGMEVERIGNTRLQIVSLISALLTTYDPVVYSETASLSTMEHLLDLFFKFSLNNFLHTQVAQCIKCILLNASPSTTFTEMCSLSKNSEENGTFPQVENGERKSTVPEGQEELLDALFTKCRIIERILDAHSECSTDPTSKSPHNLKGYMGHLREIANAIVAVCDEGPYRERVRNLIDFLPADITNQWHDFVRTTLAELNEKNKIIPVPAYSDSELDNIGGFHYADDEFRDEEISGSLQRLVNQVGQSTGASGEHPISEEDKQKLELFEALCSERMCDMESFEAMWKGREKEITFTEEPTTRSEDTRDHHSSSDEEGGEDEEFSLLRSTDKSDKMEIDEDKDWAELFDNSNTDKGDPMFNPWQSAPASDTSLDCGWADFATIPFNSGHSSPPGSQVNTGTEADERRTSMFFVADFSGAFPGSSQSTCFSAASVFDASPPFEVESSSANSCSKSSLPNSLDNICDEDLSEHHQNQLACSNDELTSSTSLTSKEASFHCF